MASSEEKRHTQSLKRHAQNQSAKSRIKTLIKKVEALTEVADATTRETELRQAMSAIQKAGRKRLLHPNTAARRVGKLARMVHRSKNAAAS